MYLFHFTLLALVAFGSTALLPSRSYLPSASNSFQGSQSQGSFQGSQSQGSFQNFGSSSTGNTRPQQAVEKNAAVLKQDTEVGENGFHYSFETSNGIRAEESNNAGNSQGGFSYKGDDGITYTITYTAGEGGYKAQGAHLPVAPPTPEAILLALQQNAKDEAAGIFDDGKYDAAKHGGGISSGSGFSSSSSGSGFSSYKSSSSSSFGSANHQGSFNSQSGYTY